MSALGCPIPDRPHAVSVSLPTWGDVVGYEEGDPRVTTAMASGYPRFLLHPQVRALFARAEASLAGPGERAWVLPSRATAARCMAFVERQGGSGRVAPLGALAVVLVPEAWAGLAKQFWQHTGEIVSSRRAEAALAGRPEDPAADATRAALRARVAGIAGVAPRDVALFPSGMAALAGALRRVATLPPGRPTAQLGFPYVDTLKLQQKLGAGALFLPDAGEADLAALERALAAGELAAVFAEFPSNPLMRAFDLPRVAAATRAAGVPLVLDDSFATFANHDFRPYADLLVSSLTKGFAGGGEAMGGALAVNPASPLYDRLQAAEEELLFGEDAAVLLAGARDFEARQATAGEHARRLVEALAAHPAVARVWYPDREARAAYEAPLRPGGGYGGMFSLLLAEPERRMPAFYDALAIAKGPSFGLRSTLACPYTLLAHYHELPWAEARGVSRYLVRVSVGLEPVGQLLASFEAALAT